jgi:hypothetical protein
MKRVRIPNLFIFLLVVCSCTYEHVESLSNKCLNSDLALSLTSTNATSCGASDGSITAVAQGGSKRYTFSLNEGTYQSNGIFSNLLGASYTVSVKDGLGCTTSQIIVVKNDGTPLEIATTTTVDSGCPLGNGTITINVTGATDPVQYKINSNAFQSGNTFTSLKGGTYAVTVVDATNCQTSASVTVARNGPSFSASISAIIANNCATSRCHDGSRSPNLTSYSNIKASASSIVSAINSNMPPGGGLTSTQINEITCWVNDGAPNN